MLYRAMVVQAIDQIFSKSIQREARQSDPDHGLAALYKDFQIILEDIDTIQSRIERIVAVASSSQAIEEGRRAMEQNNNVARLTCLATIFIPLSFVSGFLHSGSSSPSQSPLQSLQW